MIGNGTYIKIIKHKGLGDYREWICKKWLKHKRKQFQKTQTRHEFCSAPLYAAYRNAGSWSVELLFSTLRLTNTLCEILICSHCPGITSGQRIFDPPPEGSVQYPAQILFSYWKDKEQNFHKLKNWRKKIYYCYAYCQNTNEKPALSSEFKMRYMRNLVYGFGIHWEKESNVPLIITYARCSKPKTWAIVPLQMIIRCKGSHTAQIQGNGHEL